MKYHAILALSLCYHANGLASVPSEKTKTDRPNVIIIYADDLGFGDLPCYGGKHSATPTIDRLAANGIRFTQAHAVASTSTPSRYSLLTGEYAWRRQGTDVAAGNAGSVISPEQFTLADLFKQAGYSTCAIGKWHLGLGKETGKQDWNGTLDVSPADLGFDYSYIMAATADRVPCVFIENGKVANHDPSAPIEVSYTKPFQGEPLGSSHPELLYNLKSSHGHDQTIVNGIGRIGYMKGGGKALWKDENIADSIACHAIQFIKKHYDEPFFMYLATNDIHVPRFPHERFRGKSPMGLRGEAILQFDWTIQQIVNELEELNLLNNTLIIISSDNGPILDDGYQDQAEELRNGHLPSGGLRGFKYGAYEGGCRVPLIVHWPQKIKKGKTSKALVSQIDWLASLGALLQSPIPARAAPDSFNQLAALMGTDKTGRQWIVELSYNHTLSLHTQKWKYIEAHDGGKSVSWLPNIESGNLPAPQLFDMKTDEQENHNVAPSHPKIVEKLQQLLQNIRDDKIIAP